MERKIETLLRLVSDMKRFEEAGNLQSNEELSLDELDLIAAAGNPNRVPFPWENE